MEPAFHSPEQLHSLPVLLDPYPFYGWLRALSPAVFSDALNAWLVTGYSAVATLLRDPRMSSRLDIVEAEGLPKEARVALCPVIELGRAWMQQSDPPEHTLIRNPWVHLFGAGAADRIADRIRAFSSDTLQSVAQAGELDVIEAFSPLPALVLGEALGLSEHVLQQMQPFVRDYVSFRDAPSAERGAIAMVGLQKWKAQLLGHLDARRESEPNHPLLRIRDAHGDDRLFATVTSLMAGRYEPTIGVIGNGVLALMLHPEQARAAREVSITQLVDEVLRYDTAFQSAVRVATARIEVAGATIEPGERVILLLGAANRDPERFKDPDTFAPARTDSGALSFGLGPHYCLGAALARAMLEGVLDAFLRWLPRLRLPPGRPDWQYEVIGYRALRTLWLNVETPSTLDTSKKERS